jgi:hypothetical protein
MKVEKDVISLWGADCAGCMSRGLKAGFSALGFQYSSLMVIYWILAVVDRKRMGSKIGNAFNAKPEAVLTLHMSAATLRGK